MTKSSTSEELPQVESTLRSLGLVLEVLGGILEVLGGVLEVLRGVLEVLLLVLGLEEVEEVELWLGAAEHGGLHSQGSVGPVELDPSELRGLHVASQLGGGVQAALRVLAEAEASLGSDADAISIAVVQSSGDEAPDAVLAVAVQLQSPSEGCAHSVPAVADLSGDPQLGDNLTVGVDGGAEARPEAEVTVLVEETVAGSEGTDSSQSSARSEVRELLVRVDIDRRGRAEAAEDLLLGTLLLGGRVAEAEEST